MRTRPADISDDDVAAALSTHWQLAGWSLTYAAVGAGGHHWWATTDRGRYFVTIDDLASRAQSPSGRLDDTYLRLQLALGAARRLANEGLVFVIAPIPAADGAAAGAVAIRLDDRHVMSVTRHVDGVAHEWGPFPDREERAAVLALLATLHGAPVRPPLHADGFELQGRDALDRALDDLDRPWMGGPFAEPGREVLRDRRSQIVQSLRRYDRLVARETGTRGRLVVTHGEPHRGNTITTPNGSVLIDWDTTMLAPPERDLWMIAAEDPGVMDAYVAASGTRPRTSALDLYRLRWSLTDIAVYTDEIRRPHEHNEDTLTAWHQLVACCAALAR